MFQKELDIGSIIKKLRNKTSKVHPLKLITEIQINTLVGLARNIFINQPILLELVPPINVCGDIHSQFNDLVRYFDKYDEPPKTNYLFLGDFIGITHYSENLWLRFSDCFNCLPLAALIDEKIFCVHGGLSPELTVIEQIKQIRRPTEIPESGILCDLLWSDPCEEISEWGPNDRGVSYVFGSKVVERFNDRNEIDLIVRAHQVVQDGFKFFSNKRMVTVFSAPNYCDQFDNAGAMMIVEEDLTCSFFV
ncbi:serine/threonine-protein phosphatase [Anaeramoeba flamelloides]|uniref:protein-serine/threonine phosphatase n=1 Tax=Anaeramoeba flamelloides TaxID=1746091 RepID=A0AAV7YB49_9EUKA|nr:serine/threonine-protein phosphatase [Anaeramoeba flamelloides]